MVNLNQPALSDVQEPVILLKFHTIFPCHRLSNPNHFPTSTCLKEQRTMRQAFCEHAEKCSKHLGRFSFNSCSRTHHLMPNLWITRKILPTYFANITLTVVFEDLVFAYLLFSTAMFRKPSATPTALLPCVLNIWSIDGCNANVTNVLN